MVCPAVSNPYTVLTSFRAHSSSHAWRYEGCEFITSATLIVYLNREKDNVLIDERENPLICDFGVSRMLEDTTLWETSATHAPGTLRWMAPEPISGEVTTSSIQADVYAFAMTCYVRHGQNLLLNISFCSTLLSIVENHDRKGSLL